MPQQQNVIEISKLHKSYGDLQVLKGVSLTARKGDVVSLIGSSGSGKSTLLRCVNLLEDSQQGEILFNGEAVLWSLGKYDRLPADKHQVQKIRTNLSMVFQQFNLWAHMTILENVIEAPVTVLKRPRPEAEKSARRYLEQVGIGDKCDAYPAPALGCMIYTGLCWRFSPLVLYLGPLPPTSSMARCAQYQNHSLRQVLLTE